MTRALLASRYAQALFSLAVEKDLVDRIEQELAESTELIQSKEFAAVFLHPKVEKQAKKSLLAKVLVGVHPIVQDFLSMIVDKRRETALARMSIEYASLAAVHRGEVRASVTSAVPLTSSELSAIKERISSDDKTVILEEKLDSSILGGLVIRIGNKIYDGSVAEQVRRLRHQLTQAEVGLQR